jgi:hypothetical protein
MSQGFGSSYASSPLDNPDRMGGTAEDLAEEELPAHALDSHVNQALLAKLRDWYDQEWQRQAANRYQMALDEDYYDSMQWTEEDAQELLDRGQAPLVFNEIKPTIDWMLGTERRTRIDAKVLARRKEGTSNAEAKTSLMKYLSDTNKTPHHRSMAFADATKAGVGWIETGVRGDPTDELNYTRRENWRNVVYDSNSVERDGSDMRYLFRMRWLDRDIGEAYFPDRKDIIAASVQSGNSLVQDDEDFYYMGARVTQPGHDYQAGSVGKYTPYDSTAYAWSRRERVKLIECWYRIPVLTRKFGSGPLEGEVFDSTNPEHAEALKGQYSLYDKPEMEVRCAIFCDGGLVFDGKSPYKHGRIPFVPVWCYRRARDNAPYGAIRNLRDPQDDLNKRASKALFILSTNRVMADEGAVDDWDELRREVARPDSLIIKKQGKSIEISRDTALANEHLQLMERDIQHIRNVGGVTAENLGRQTNADSGKAIMARQDQGGVITTEPFDNLRYAVQLVGEMELSNIEQFYTDEKVVRILGDRGGAKFIELNMKDPATGEILNDITAFQADYIVSEQDYRSSLRQAMFESMFDIVGRLAQMNPQVALNLLDLVVEMADLPNKDELVARIRKINGQADPDAELSPEEEAAAKKAADEQAALVTAQNDLALQTMRTQLSKLVAETEKLDAQAMREKITAMYSALQAAGVVATIPGAAAVADEIMHGAGYVDATTKQNAQMIEAAAEAQQALPQQQPQIPSDAMPPSAAVGAMGGIETPEIE